MQISYYLLVLSLNNSGVLNLSPKPKVAVFCVRVDGKSYYWSVSGFLIVANLLAFAKLYVLLKRFIPLGPVAVLGVR